jgi:hypothetical protein
MSRARLGINRTWRSRWFARKDYGALLHEDLHLKAVATPEVVRTSQLEGRVFDGKFALSAQYPRRKNQELKLGGELTLEFENDAELAVSSQNGGVRGQLADELQARVKSQVLIRLNVRIQVTK